MSFSVCYKTNIKPFGLGDRYTGSCYINHLNEPESKNKKIVVINGVVCSVEKITTYEFYYANLKEGVTCLHHHEALVTPARPNNISADFKAKARAYLEEVDSFSNALSSYQSPYKRKLDSACYVCEFREGEPPIKILTVMKSQDSGKFEMQW